MAELPPLPCCPCGSRPAQVTIALGRTRPEDDCNPGTVTLEPCGHVLKAFTPEHAQWQLAYAAYRTERNARG